ncbi:MAG: ZIP family metal transporter [Planctomycetaceae bacterium]|nr:ZIP family metal transporter [Planctomycetaceae bacterium]
MVLFYCWLVFSLSAPVVAQETPANREIRPLPPSKVMISIDETQLGHRFRLLMVYTGIIVCASLAGGYLPEKIRLTHTRLQVLMSLVGGLMLGVALFHLLLHALLDSSRSELDDVLSSLALGILTMFLLLRLFHFHQHDVTPVFPGIEQAIHQECEHSSPGHGHAHLSRRSEVRASLEAVAQNPGVSAKDSGPGDPVIGTGMDQQVLARHPATSLLEKHRYSWVGIALGLGLHSVMDGVALSASLLRPVAVADSSSLVGLATFLAVLLHKPLDAISITSVMSASGWSRSMCTLANFSFAVMCPLGAVLAWWGILGTHSHAYVVSQLLAFSAGVFLCIALSDLLPEMQFHGHNQILLAFSLLLGLTIAWLLMYINPMHSPMI